MGDHDQPANSDAVKRADGSWIVDGAMTLERFREVFPEAPAFAGEISGDYRTLGGYVMAEIGRIAAVSDSVHHEQFRMEVVDMDGKRVDKLLVHPPREDTGV